MLDNPSSVWLVARIKELMLSPSMYWLLLHVFMPGYPLFSRSRRLGGGDGQVSGRGMARLNRRRGDRSVMALFSHSFCFVIDSISCYLYTENTGWLRHQTLCVFLVFSRVCVRSWVLPGVLLRLRRRAPGVEGNKLKSWSSNQSTKH